MKVATGNPSNGANAKTRRAVGTGGRCRCVWLLHPLVRTSIKKRMYCKIIMTDLFRSESQYCLRTPREIRFSAFP